MQSFILNRPARLYGAVSLAVLAASLLGAPTSRAQTTAPNTAQPQTAQTTTTTPAPATKPADKTAQPPADPKTATPDASGTDTTITITGQKSAVQRKTDRDVYDVKQDPQAATGSAADVLNNVPAVTVDPDGTVQLRGNSSVQVYVNGKKSPQMSADNRGFSLQNLSGDDIDSIEVITNPSAEFGADSAGGIINIVMKRGRSIKPITSMNIVLGDQGRGSLNLRTGKTFGKLTFNVTGSINHGSGGDGGGQGGRGGRGGGSGPKSKSYSDRFRLDPTTGAVTREDQTTTVAKSDNNSSRFNLDAQYNLNDNDSLEGQFDYSANHRDSTRASEIVSYDGNHLRTGDRASLQDQSRDGENTQFNLAYDHRGEIGTSEDFKMQISHSSSLNDSHTTIRNVYHSPGQPDDYSAQASKSKDYIDEFSGDWTHPFAATDTSGQQIKTGWDVQHTVSDQYSYRSLTSASPVQSPALPRASAVSQYNVDQTLTAAYFIYELKVGKFQSQFGLRAENLHQTMDGNNPVTGVTQPTATYDNLFYSPNVILLYNLTDKQQVKFSYTQKLSRPSANQLNPLIVLSEDGLTARSGNASLKPEKTDKYELRYTRDTTTNTNASLSLHYDSTTGSINNVTTFLTGSPEVLLYTYDNSGTRRQTGVDFSLNGNTADRKLRFGLNGTLNYFEAESTDFVTHLPVKYSGPSSSINGNVNYKLTPVDTLTVAANYNGKQTGYQFYSTQVARLNVSYTHQIIPNKMILTVNASNFLFGPTSKTYRESSTSRQFGYTVNPGATFMVSLRYTFGQAVPQRGGGQGFRRNDGQSGRGGGGSGNGGYPGGGGGGF